MVRNIVHDTVFLAMKSEPATSADLNISEDLYDTLVYHKEKCVGMAANMIGERKCIIAFLDESEKTPEYVLMFNPKITYMEGKYTAEEGCLSLLGGKRKCERYKKIKVEYQNAKMQKRVKTYTGFTAQIIQHEIDHTNGILI